MQAIQVLVIFYYNEFVGAKTIETPKIMGDEFPRVTSSHFFKFFFSLIRFPFLQDYWKYNRWKRQKNEIKAQNRISNSLLMKISILQPITIMHSLLLIFQNKKISYKQYFLSTSLNKFCICYREKAGSMKILTNLTEKRASNEALESSKTQELSSNTPTRQCTSFDAAKWMAHKIATRWR